MECRHDWKFDVDADLYICSRCGSCVSGKTLDAAYALDQDAQKNILLDWIIDCADRKCEAVK